MKEMGGIALVLLVVSVFPARASGQTCWSDTLKIFIDTTEFTGNTAELRFELTNSEPKRISGYGDYVHFVRVADDAKRQQRDTSYGGPIDANLFGDNIFLGQGWIHSEDSFYNAEYVDFDSLGSFLSFDFELFDFPDTSQSATEFAVQWLHFPRGAPDYAAYMFPTTDPYANTLFSVTAWNDSCELAVFSPMVFVPPDSIIYSPPVTGTVNVPPDLGLKFLGAFPNPANGRVRFRFIAGGAGFIALRVYDIQGRLVYKDGTTLEASGTHEIVWPGRNDHGGMVSSGVYFAQISNGKKAIIRKVVIVD